MRIVERPAPKPILYHLRCANREGCGALIECERKELVANGHMDISFELKCPCCKKSTWWSEKALNDRRVGPV